MQKEVLLNQLSALDFMAVDMHLYLDTHPTDKIAVKEYNKIIKEADMVRAKYEKLYGPLCSFRSESPEDFEWVNDPWPWEVAFNSKTRGEN